MAIKKLQNDYTTPEQSKRLLKLGVPVKSANYKHPLVGTCDGTCVLDMDTVVNCDYLCDGEIPLWSVGRLIEIAELCFDFILPNSHEYYIKMKDCNTDYLIRMFELCANNMDFSKLEE